MPGHAYLYAYAASGGCGPAPGAGADTNRSSMSDNGVTTTYCYDVADRLTSASDPTVGTPAYDAHGNTTTLGLQTMTYDGADRHLSTTTATTALRYVRDATDRIVARTVGGATQARYGFSGDGDTADFVMDASGTVIERDLPLVGGVLVTKRSGGDGWSYPNIHGDVVATANASGLKQGLTLSYDPFGTALTTPPDNSAGNYDYGWLGQHQRGLEHEGALATIEMGARQYLPGLGRFLEVDPVEGGCANDYTYVRQDPVNFRDLDGQRCEGQVGYNRGFASIHYAGRGHGYEWSLRLFPDNHGALITVNADVFINGRTTNLHYHKPRRRDDYVFHFGIRSGFRYRGDALWTGHTLKGGDNIYIKFRAYTDGKNGIVEHFSGWFSCRI